MSKKQVVEIGLRASDQASPVFQKVAKEADDMKRRIEAANKATVLRNDWLHSGSQVRQTRRYSKAAASTAGAAGDVKGLSSSASVLSDVLASNKVAVAAWGASIVLAGKAALEASLKVDRLEKAYATIEGSSAGARIQLDQMYETTNRLGLQFYDTAEAAKGFFAAMKGTAIADEANMIFEGVTSAVSALSLSRDETERVFRALGQMVSKGKVQAEDLRGQLGEALPGAFQMMAKAMKVSTAELDKMLERGQVLADEALPKLGRVMQEEFGQKAMAAAQGIQQNLNRVSTEWERFKASILNSEVVAQNLRRIADAVKSLNDSKQWEERKRKADPEMRKAGIKPEGEEWAPTGAYVVPVYTDAQFERWFAAQEKAAAAQKAVAKAGKETEKILNSSSGIINAYLINTYDAQRKLADDRYAEVQKAIEAKIAEYKKDGVDISGLLKQMELAADVHRQELAALRTRFSRKDPGILAKKQADKQAKAEAKAYKQETRDLDVVADAMRELEEKSGQYGLSIEYTNQLIARQGELWLKAGVPQGYVDQLMEIRRLEASREGWAGAMLATQEYYTEATNMAEAYKGVVTNAFSGMEDAIVNACMTGKLSFSDMVNSMIADLMRLMVRQSITGPLASALGQGIGNLFAVPNGYNFTAQLNGFSSANPAVDFYAGMGLHNGGVVGKDSPSFIRYVPSALFAGAPRFHSGTGYVKPGEYPAILKAGERVLNPAETRAYQSRREPVVNVNIVNSTGQQASTRTRSDNHGNKTIDVYVGDMAAKQMATPGSTLNRAVSAQTGTRRPAIRR